MNDISRSPKPYRLFLDKRKQYIGQIIHFYPVGGIHMVPLHIIDMNLLVPLLVTKLRKDSLVTMLHSQNNREGNLDLEVHDTLTIRSIIGIIVLLEDTIELPIT